MSNIQKFLQQFKIYDCPDLTKLRIGNNGDGGYVALKEICEQTDTVYSFGIGDDVGFELDFANQFPQAKFKLFDPTIEQLPEEHPRFEFFKKEFAGRHWTEELSSNSLLKVDIEHNEWSGFFEYSDEELKGISQILIEFHMLHIEDTKNKSPYFTKLYQALYDELNNKLFAAYYTLLERLNNYFYIFHIHPNNSLPMVTVGGHTFPPLLEVSFVRKDLVNNPIETKLQLPIDGLDFPNKTDRQDIKNWFPLC